VVIRKRKVDAAATGALRLQMRSGAMAPEMFSFGPVRLSYEAAWPDSLQRAVNEATEGIPPLVREHVRHELMEGMEKNGEMTVSAEELRARVAAILDCLAAGRPPRD
jgi:hypothetical protein